MIVTDELKLSGSRNGSALDTLMTSEIYPEFIDCLKPLNEAENVIIESIPKSTGLGKQSARNAIRHINQAVRIFDIDKEMSVLRAYTGREEASQAILYSVKSKKYDRAEKLNIKNHYHKAGLWPLIQVLHSFFHKQVSIADFDPRFYVSKDDGKILTSFSGKTIGLEGRFEPIPPLNFQISQENICDDHIFDEQIREFCNTKNKESFKKYLNEIVQQRHMLLYASQEGVAYVTVGDQFLQNRRREIFFLLTIYLLIEQYNEKQLFVQQALYIYTKMLEEN